MLKNLTKLVRIIRKDKLVKISLSALCLTSLVLGIWCPYLTIHGTVLGFVTNMIWLWEA
jgi:hypothetical protein